jgi:two-component system, LuxR family, response regulator FixJ
MPDLERVFVVDDDLALRMSINRSLTLRGYSVAHFKSAAEFLAEYGDGQPGCLILDYGMPGMNGLELQSHLLSHDRLIPIIFVTGHAGIPESVRATKAGAIDFLEKPYRLEVLIDRIEIALDLDRKRRRELSVRRDFCITLDSLTPREKEIHDLICRRPDLSSSKAIARELDISPRTVDLHRARILEKMGCMSVADLIAKHRQLISD